MQSHIRKMQMSDEEKGAEVGQFNETTTVESEINSLRGWSHGWDEETIEDIDEHSFLENIHFIITCTAKLMS